MKLSLIRSLSAGRYYVVPKMEEISQQDREKLAKFGSPVVAIKNSDGRILKIPLSQVELYKAFGFYNEDEANNYAHDLRNQLSIIKKDWENKEDNWSKTEEI